ncbi:UNVERIFIED_CONTAM: SEC14 cytosolic factor [Sesamum calycinum]|uniref:SEC14 cytosolic factor n=1 Tax=Sesamum calycinum TaxID=2727403 RepID=A0AAW2PN75_9LAMI
MTSYLRQKWQSFQIGTSESEDVQEEALNSENREEIERSKIGIMRAVVQAQDPSAKDIDDLMIRRFLRARDLDVEKASAMLLKYLKWRKEFVPNGFVTFTLDKICARMPSGHEKFTSIADLQGWGYANSDIRGYLAALSILQDCYPERLGKLFIIHAPYIFMTAWKMVYPFIDKNTKKKIIFVEDKKLQSTLLQDIDESQLPETFGGKTKLVPIQEC